MRFCTFIQKIWQIFENFLASWALGPWTPSTRPTPSNAPAPSRNPGYALLFSLGLLLHWAVELHNVDWCFVFSWNRPDSWDLRASSILCKSRGLLSISTRCTKALGCIAIGVKAQMGNELFISLALHFRHSGAIAFLFVASLSWQASFHSRPSSFACFSFRCCVFYKFV